MKAKNPESKSQYVLIRTLSAGVHVGQLAHKDGSEVVLKNASRVWRWRGANTLHELSLAGPARGSYTRISERVDEITVLGVIEIIPVKTSEAAFSPVWND